MKHIIFLLVLVTTFVIYPDDKAASITTNSQVAIITHVYNRPDFIELHKKTFDAFIQEKYRYVVFNDASDEGMSQTIQATCKNLGIECFRVPDHAPHRQSPGHRHMDGIKFSLEQVGFQHNGIVMIIDADMFPIKPINLHSYMKNHDFIGGYQERHDNNITIEYSSPCLVIMNMHRLPNKTTLNFDGDTVEGVTCDVGGHSYYYFRDNPSVNVHLYTAISKDFLPMNREALLNLGYDTNSIDLLLNVRREYGFEFHGDTYFIHFYAGGSNWPGYSASFINDKTVALNNFIDKQIAYYTHKQ